MAVTLTEAISRLNKPGDAVLVRGLVPNSGMAQALSQFNNVGQQDRGYAVQGGKGSPYGALETRVSTKATIKDVGNGFGRAVKSYLKDPFEFKRKLEEEKSLAKEAMKHQITKTEANLLWGNARGLFSTATNAQTSILFGLFEVVRLQTRYAIAQAKVLGVKSTDLRKPAEDPSRGPLAKIFGSVFSNIKRIPGMEFLTSLTKQSLNLAKFLNPLTMGTRVMNLIPGQWIQKLLMGKESYDLMKNPEKAREKAGLQLTDQQRTVNLMKATAGYLREQLSVQTNMLRGIQEIVKLMGSELKVQKLDIGHDEYTGELKTGFELEQAQLKRDAALTAVYQKAAKHSLPGKLSSLTNFATFNFKWKIQRDSRKNREKVSDFDRQFLTDLVQNDKIFAFMKFLSKREPNNSLVLAFKELMDKTKGKLDFFSKDPEITAALIRLKDKLYDEYNYPSSQWKTKGEYVDFRDAFDLAQDTAGERVVSQRASYQNMRKVSNLFSGIGGGRDVYDTGRIISSNKFLERFGMNKKLARAHAGGAMEDVLSENLQSNLWSNFLRSIPLYGIKEGWRQGKRLTEIGNDVGRLMAPDSNPEDPMSKIYNEISQSSEKKEESRKISLTRTGGGLINLPDTGDPLANSIGFVFRYLFYNVPVMPFAKLPTANISLAGAIGAIASGTADLNGLSLSAAERDEKLQEDLQRKEEKEYRDETIELWRDMRDADRENNRMSSEERYRIRGKEEKEKQKDWLDHIQGFGSSIFKLLGGKKGLGLVGSGLLLGTETGRSIASYVWENLLQPTFKGVFTLLVDKLPEWGSSLFGMAIDFTKEHPLMGAGLWGALALKLIPGPIGTVMKAVIGTVKKPIFALGGLALGFVVNSFFGSSKDDAPDKKSGGFFGGDMMKKLFGGGTVGKMFGKLAPWITRGLTFGLRIFTGPIGFIASILLSGVVGKIMDFLSVESILDIPKAIFNKITGEDEKQAQEEKKNEDRRNHGGADVEVERTDFVAKYLPFVDEKIKLTLEKDEHEEFQKLKLPGDKEKFLKKIQLKRKKEQQQEAVRKMKESNSSDVQYDPMTGMPINKPIFNFGKEDKEAGGPDLDAIPGGNLGGSAQWKANTSATKSYFKAKEDASRSEIDNEDASGYLVAKAKLLNKNSSTMGSEISGSDRELFAANQQKINEKNKDLPENSSNDALDKAVREASDGKTGADGLNWLEQAIVGIITGALSVGSSALGGIGSLVGKGLDAVSSFIGGGGTSVPSKINPSDITSTSAYFESSGRQDTVAYDTGGGTSYGSHQLASKSSMKDFLAWVKGKGEQGKKIYDTMYQSVGGNWNKLNTGSKFGPPVDAWKSLANSGIIGDLDKQFFVEAWFPRTISSITPPSLRKMVLENKPLQHALFSGMVHHGEAGVKALFRDAYKEGMSPEEFIHSFYSLRAQRKQGTAATYRGLMRRYKEEEGIILAMINPSKYGKQQNQATTYAGNIPSPSGFWHDGHKPNITSQDLEAWKISPNEGLVWPANSNVITSPMGPRNVKGGSSWHGGIDIRGTEADPAKATMAGEVIGTSPRYNTVAIKHPNGWISKYLHMSKVGVKKGDKVEAGQEIGKIGGIGKNGTKAYPSHLHFEMLKDGKKVDPEGVFYEYSKNGGRSAYDGHSYAGIEKNRQIESKILSKYTLSNKQEGKEAAGSWMDKGFMKNHGPLNGIGGPEEDNNLGLNKIQKGKFFNQKTNSYKDQIDEIKREEFQLNVDEENKKIEENPILKEVKKTNKIALASLKQQAEAPAPTNVAISTPQGAVASGSGGGSLNLGDSVIDGLIDRLFGQIGNMISDFNIAHTNLGITTV